MRKLVALLIVAFVFTGISKANDWENPEIFKKNREDARATFYAYDSEAKALANNLNKADYIKSLNGIFIISCYENYLRIII